MIMKGVNSIKIYMILAKLCEILFAVCAFWITAALDVVFWVTAQPIRAIYPSLTLLLDQIRESVR